LDLIGILKNIIIVVYYRIERRPWNYDVYGVKLLNHREENGLKKI